MELDLCKSWRKHGQGKVFGSWIASCSQKVDLE